MKTLLIVALTIFCIWSFIFCRKGKKGQKDLKNVNLWIVLVFHIYERCLFSIRVGFFLKFNYKYDMFEQQKPEPIPLILQDKFSALKNDNLFFYLILTSQILYAS